jgi:hypothetical protein
LAGKSFEYYLSILGLTLKATKDEIKKAYHRIIKVWHPDKFTNDNEKYLEATEKSKLINEAYHNLKNYTPNVTTITADRIRVKSSNIHSVGYDSQEMILQIQFLKGGVYKYYGVPETVFNALMRAESKGKFARRNIYYNYRYERVA